MTSPLPVTVVVPVKNEEKNLPRCLAALGDRYGEVFVVDSASTDKTPQIAREYGATLINFDWDGKFPKKRNWFMDNHDAQFDWHLFLDADEVVSPEFTEELARAINDDSNTGYWLTYLSYFMGKPLRYGVPQRKLALFRKSAGRYERIEEGYWSNLDMEVHEHPQLNGEIGEIHAKIDHRDFQGLGKFVTRHLDYAKWEMARYQKILGSAEFDKLTGRQKSKYTNLEKWWFPTAYFLFNYIVRLGFLDGHAGLQYSFYKAWYFNTIRLLIKEDRAQKSSS